MTDVERVLALLRNPSPLNGCAVGWDGCGDRFVTGPTPRRYKVAIVGACPSRAGLPLDDPSWEIWGCNALYGACRDKRGKFRADRWWEMHPLSQPPQSDLDLIGIQASPIPIYTLEHESSVSMGARFPIEQCLTLPNARDYFTSTFSYQVAFAVALGFQEIALYGVELTGGREYLLERPCLEYWMGYAAGRGVKVTTGEESALCWTPFRYGYSYDEEKEFGEAMQKRHDGYYQHAYPNF